MREIFVDVATGAIETLNTYAGDNLPAESYKVVVLKNKIRLDLTKKQVKLCCINPKNKFVRIFDLKIADDPRYGECELDISNQITMQEGVLDCQLAILSENGFVEQTGHLKINVKNSLFIQARGIMQDQWDFGKIGDILNNAKKFGDDIPYWTEFFNNAKQDEKRRDEKITNFEVDLSDLRNSFDSAVANVTNGNKDATNSEVASARAGYGSLGSRLDEMSTNISNLLYKPMTITSFTNNKNVVEKGTVINDVILNWDLNKQPKTLTLDGQSVDVSLRKEEIRKSITGNTTFTLEATDERGAKSTKQTSITFLNGVYYGVSGADIKDSSGILNLQSKVLSDTRSRKINVNAGQGQYIYYCVPSRLGNCRFVVNGFEGGFNKTTVEFKNPQGFTENYDVWKTTNANLGNTDVTIL